MTNIDIENNQEKLYYSIGEIASMFQVNTSLIRFWEKEFDVLKPKKNKKGNRLFTTSDVMNLKLIFHLVKEKGYTLDGAKKKLQQGIHEIDEEVSAEASLLKVREFLVVLKEQL